MPRLRGQKPETRDAHPDAESLSAFAEKRISGPAHDGIAQHLTHCSVCAELHERLLDFARPAKQIDAKEWAGAEKRLGIWMEGVLRAERQHPAAPPHASARWGWSASWKIAWALGVVAVLLMLTTLYVYQPWGPKSPSPPVAASPAASAPPAAGTGGNAVPEDVVPLSAAVPEADSSHRAMRGEQTENLPAVRKPETKMAAAINPDTRKAIAEDIRLHIAADRDAAAQSGRDTKNSETPTALSPSHTTFLVSSLESVQTNEGQTCSLTPGDVLTRLSASMDAEQNVTAQVTAGKNEDCSGGARIRIAAQELQEMHNDLRAQIDAGLADLAENAQDRALTKEPALGRTPNRDGIADPQSGAGAVLENQQAAADNAEDEVQEAMDYSPASALREGNSDQAAAKNVSAKSALNLAPNARTPRLLLAALAQSTPQQAPTRPARPRPTAPTRPGVPEVEHYAAKPAPFRPPAESTKTPDGKGGSLYTTPDGTAYRVSPGGQLASLTTPSGTEARFTLAGQLGSIRTTGGMLISHAAGGARRIESSEENGVRVVSTGRARGFVEYPFERDGREFVARTYVGLGRLRARVFARVSYAGAYFYRFIPNGYYAPAFYAWAYNPWDAPVAWSWGWHSAPWYGYYGNYFTPNAVYASASAWLTDYVLAENLKSAYDAQVSAGLLPMPVPQRPQVGVQARNRAIKRDAISCTWVC